MVMDDYEGVNPDIFNLTRPPREPLFAHITIQEVFGDRTLPHRFDFIVNSNCEYIAGEEALQLINFIRQRCDDWEKAREIRFDKLKPSDQ